MNLKREEQKARKEMLQDMARQRQEQAEALAATNAFIAETARDLYVRNVALRTGAETDRDAGYERVTAECIAAAITFYKTIARFGKPEVAVDPGAPAPQPPTDANGSPVELEG